MRLFGRFQKRGSQKFAKKVPKPVHLSDTLVPRWRICCNCCVEERPHMKAKDGYLPSS